MGYLITFFLAVLAGVVITSCNPSEAATFSGKVEICENLGENAYSVAQMRDAGVPWEKFEAWLKPQLDAAIADPDTYTKSPEDVAYILDLFKRVYDSELVAEAVPAWASSDCMKSKPAARQQKQKLTV